MKKLIIFFILAIIVMYFFGSCSDKPKCDPKFNYINIDCVIVEKIPNVPAGRIGSKAFLIRCVKDTTMYTEYTSLDSYYMPDSVYYNHEVGDILHFDYIRKNRFFYKN